MSIVAQLKAGITTRSAEQMRALASEFAPLLPTDTVLALHGDMGVGKTTFVQGLAQGLGVTDHVTSPTYTIFTLHRGGKSLLVHLDAYRLESEHQIDALMLEDFLTSPWILAVEWPEKIASWIPAEAWHLDLVITPDEAHTVSLRG